MAGTSNVVRIRIVGDAKSLQKATDDAAGAIGKLEGSGSRLSGVLAGAFTATAILSFAKSSVKAASDIEESLNKIRVLVGLSVDEVSQWSKTTAASFGISRRAALEYVGTFANLLDKLGKTGDETAMMSQRLTELAADLASFSNTPVSQALTAIQSGLQGQSRPLRQYGVLLSDAVLKERAMSMGLRETTKGVLPPLIRMEAAYAEILAQTTKAQGDFKRTAESTANQTKTLQAEFDDLRVAIGQELNPVAKSLLRSVAEWLPAFELAGKAIAGLGQSAGLSHSQFLPILMTIVSFKTALRLATPAIDGLNAGLKSMGSTAVIAKGPWVALASALTAYATVVYLDVKRRQAEAIEATDKLTEALIAQGDPVAEATKRMMELADALGKTEKTSNTAAVELSKLDDQVVAGIAARDKTADQFNKLGISAQQMADIARNGAGAFDAALNIATNTSDVAGQLNDVETALVGVNAVQADWIRGLFQAQAANLINNNELRAMLRTMSHVGGAFDDLREKLQAETSAALERAQLLGYITADWRAETEAKYASAGATDRWLGISKDLDARLSALGVSTKKLVGDAQKLALEHGNNVEKAHALQSAIEELTDAYQKEQDALLATIDAEFAATSAKRKAAESNDDLAEKTAELAEATKQYGADSKEAKDAQKAYNDAVESSISDSKAAALAVKSMMERQNESGEANYTATEIQAAYIAMLHELASTASDPAVKAALEGIATRFEENAKKADSAAKKINDYIGALNGIKAADKVAALAELGIGVPVPGKAVGGPVQAGQPYLVGEQGPELFMPQRSGTIIPNGDLAAAGQGGGVTIVVNSPLGRPDDVVRWMREELRRLDRGQR